MFHSYPFLNRLSKQLNTLLKNAVIVESFSQQRDELIIGLILADNEEFYIKASLDNEINLISFKSDFHRARKNSIDLFERVINQKIIAVESVFLDRSFYLKLSNGELILFKLHGNRSNIICITENENLLFKSKLKNDHSLKVEDLQKNINLDEIEDDQLATIEKIITENSMTFLRDKYDYDKVDVDQKKTVIKTFFELFDQLNLGISNNEPSSIKIAYQENQNLCFQSNDAIELSNKLYFEKINKDVLLKRKSVLIREINKDLKKARNYISKSRHKLTAIKERKSYEEIANLIMANLHIIERNSRYVELDDFYTNRKIEIKLNPDLSPQKNAEQYYKKSKNEKIEIQNIEKNIQNKEKAISSFIKEIELIEDIEKVSDLNKLTKEKRQINEKENQRKPYKVFYHNQYEIRVGKNAKDNDELTLKYSKKDDIWLHARDVAGSHVIIVKNRNEKVPKDTIEYAASLAASNSKRKQDSLCPVIITSRKYIRKGKGLPPGKVIVEKEEVIMVKPKSYQ
jgi:predicted ribosome quality control (RQC) complex YloA/Tae2 family protein